MGAGSRLLPMTVITGSRMNHEMTYLSPLFAVDRVLGYDINRIENESWPKSPSGWLS